MKLAPAIMPFLSIALTVLVSFKAHSEAAQDPILESADPLCGHFLAKRGEVLGSFTGEGLTPAAAETKRKLLQVFSEWLTQYESQKSPAVQAKIQKSLMEAEFMPQSKIGSNSRAAVYSRNMRYSDWKNFFSMVIENGQRDRSGLILILVQELDHVAYFGELVESPLRSAYYKSRYMLTSRKFMTRESERRAHGETWDFYQKLKASGVSFEGLGRLIIEENSKDNEAIRKHYLKEWEAVERDGRRAKINSLRYLDDLHDLIALEMSSRAHYIYLRLVSIPSLN